MKHSYRLALAVLVGSIAAATTHAAPPEPGFWLLGKPPGAGGGGVRSLNKDGSMAAGYAGMIGYTWTREGGRVDFGLLPGMPDATPALALSDTEAVAGNMYKFNGPLRAYRWTGTGPLQDLGVLPGETAMYAAGISGDGQVVIGHGEHGQSSVNGQAYRWTPSGGLQGLGWLKPGSLFSEANGISRNGQTIVGASRVGFDDEAFVWTEATGMKALPSLPGAPFAIANAQAVSADGSVVVGGAASANGQTHAVRWIDGKVLDLGTLPGKVSSFAYAVSDDGSIVGGQSSGDIAILWTAKTGLAQASDYLAMFGVSVPSEYKLTSLRAISGDGLTFGGIAQNVSTLEYEGFVATIPGPGACIPDCDETGSLNIDDFICFQTFFALGDTKADCDASGQLNIDDFICFQTAFVIGC